MLIGGNGTLMELDFEIDKITESIESAETGKRFKTYVWM